MSVDMYGCIWLRTVFVYVYICSACVCMFCVLRSAFFLNVHPHDETSGVRHVRRMFHPGRGLGGPRARRTNMHFTSSSTGGLSSSQSSSYSPSNREAMDPIAGMCTQLSVAVCNTSLLSLSGSLSETLSESPLEPVGFALIVLVPSVPNH